MSIIVGVHSTKNPKCSIKKLLFLVPHFSYLYADNIFQLIICTFRDENIKKHDEERTTE